MTLSCPHCNLLIDLDLQTQAALQGQEHFECPGCQGLIPVPFLQGKLLEWVAKGTTTAVVPPPAVPAATGPVPGAAGAPQPAWRRFLVPGAVGAAGLLLVGFMASRGCKPAKPDVACELPKPLPGVVLHFKFTEGRGEVARDLSGAGRDGRLIGFEDLRRRAGENGSGWREDGCLVFDGVDDRVETRLMTADFAYGVGFTLEAIASHADPDRDWGPMIGSGARRWDDPGALQLAKNTNGSKNSLGMPSGPPDAIGWRISGLVPPRGVTATSTRICDGELHHLAFVYDARAAAARLYFNHERLLVWSGIAGRISGNYPILVGANGWDAREKWFGRISEIRITRRPLEPAQFLPPPPGKQKPKP
jgi:hypothetical protein